jgi:hypothetical protein
VAISVGWDCFVATAPRNDKGGVIATLFIVIAPFLFVIASPSPLVILSPLYCHCERSVAISVGRGIASSLPLLAMTKEACLAMTG